MEHMKEMDWEAILEQEDMNREGFEYIDEDEEASVEHWSKSSYSLPAEKTPCTQVNVSLAK